VINAVDVWLAFHQPPLGLGPHARASTSWRK
jgi:hypothetical protein